MKIGIVQIRPVKADISRNIKAHIRLIEKAIGGNASAIFFPELSLTGYEPELAKGLATDHKDSRLNIFQQISDKHEIIIGVGLPTTAENGIRISMIVFRPGQPRQTYSKQQLHPDELPYFENGIEQLIITHENIHIAPAICFESLQVSHVKSAVDLGANLYLASVAKSANGFERASKYYPELAKKYSVPVLMSNCIGYCDNFLSVGKSSVWTKDGVLAGQLDDQKEGVLIFDTDTEEVISLTENQ